MGRAGLAHLTHLPGGIQARRVGGWGVLGLREKRVRLEGPLLDRTPVSKNMPLFTAPLASQRLEEIFSRVPPTHQAGSKPAWQVGEVRKPSATHPPRGQHPAAGCCLPPRWAETNYLSVINQLPARASPFLLMTEATSMTLTAENILSLHALFTCFFAQYLCAKDKTKF